MAIAHEQITRVIPTVRTEPIRPASAHRAGLLLAAAGWTALVLMWTTRSAQLFGHDQHGVPIPLAVFPLPYGMVGHDRRNDASIEPPGTPQIGWGYRGEHDRPKWDEVPRRLLPRLGRVA